MQGAGEQHRRFWRQMVLWLARQDDSDQDALRVASGGRSASVARPAASPA
jgi:heme oxygenase